MCEILPVSSKPTLNVFKFGGSCFKDEMAFIQSLRIVNHYQNNALIIICSALQGITDKLIELGSTISQQGTFENNAQKLYNEIKTKHLQFINSLFEQNQEIQKSLISYLDQTLEKITQFVPSLTQQGMTPKNSDWLISFGERISTYLYSQYLKMKGFETQFLSTDDNLIITNDDFGNSLPILDQCEINISNKLSSLLQDKKIVVLPGFYGSTKSGEITTLGRGGSDFSATIIAYALVKDFDVHVIFWKDVYGILSTNPKIVPNAKLLAHISYAEAKELAYFGSKILHPKCLKMTEQRDIPTEIRCFTDPFSEKFTLITKQCIIPHQSNEIIKGIASMESIAMVTVQSDAMISLPGSAANVFNLMGQNNINIIFISQSSSENNITFGTNPENGFKAGQVLSQNAFFGKNWFKIIVDHDAALISVVGAGMVKKPGIAGLLFTTLGNANINIRAIAQGSSETNITLVLSKDDVKRAIQTIYNAFINGNLPKIPEIQKW